MQDLRCLAHCHPRLPSPVPRARHSPSRHKPLDSYIPLWNPCLVQGELCLEHGDSVDKVIGRDLAVELHSKPASDPLAGTSLNLDTPSNNKPVSLVIRPEMLPPALNPASLENARWWCKAIGDILRDRHPERLEPAPTRAGCQGTRLEPAQGKEKKNKARAHSQRSSEASCFQAIHRL